MTRPTARASGLALVTVGASLLATVGLVPTAGTAPAAAQPAAATVRTAADPIVDGAYTQRFLDMYEDIHDPANGYFSPQGIPYHAVETLLVEAPDYGHETTSEAYSYWLELEAMYGRVTGDWQPFNDAWATMEKYMIPQQVDQPTNSFYDPSKPATYASEYNTPNKYPSALNSGVSVGRDPLAAELKSAYGTSDIYGMHWLADVDNIYGFGASPGTGCENGPSSSGTSYINTFQRGPQESVWETVPQPACEEFKYGGRNGFLDLFTQDSSYAKQWKYTNAPDADARAVQAAYWANVWATEQGNASDVSATVAKAAKMGDYLRYAMFDKYFKTIGCTSQSCAAGTGKDSEHYLLSWYYAWGGALDSSAGWAWRIGSSHAHFGYQNPMTAWALSTQSAMKPRGSTAVTDWDTSLDRQLEFYRWLQSPQGGIAGGATNSWDGAYATPPSGTPTFYGMAYQEAPVYVDPPSTQWFGMQVWGMERVAELYYASGDERAKELLDNWVPWAIANTTFSGADWSVPSDLKWSGKPDTWNAANPGSNSGLSVQVTSHGKDVGVAGSLARTLMYYAAASGDTDVRDKAQALLDAIWTNDRDDKGVSTPETRKDYQRFDDVYSTSTGDGTYVPNGWQGTMPNGDVIKPGVSFLDIRTFFRDDPDWSKVQAYLDGGSAPVFRYHRFWAQTEIAMAQAEMDSLFAGGSDDTTAPSAPGKPAVSGLTATGATLTWAAATDDVGVVGYTVRDAQGKTLATTSGTTTTLTGLTPSTAYSVTVVARDAAGNVSDASSAVAFTTLADEGDTTAPTAPGTPTASAITSTGATLSWAASTDAVGVTGYTVRTAAGATVATSTGTTVTLTGLTPSTAYTLEVVARDAAGNVSAASPRVTFTTSGTTTPSCSATYRTVNSWPGGFQGEVTVTAGTTALTSWSTTLTLPSGASVAQGWSATFSGSAPAYTVRNAAWNGSLGAGQSVTYGFVGSGNPSGTTVTCG